MAEKKQICKIHYKSSNAQVDLAGLSEIFSKLESPSILGGNDAGRFSYWAGEPVEIFEFNSTDNQPFEKLQRVLDKYSLAENDKNNLTTIAEAIYSYQNEMVEYNKRNNYEAYVASHE